MAQSGMELSYPAGTCPISPASSCLPTATYSIGTHSVDSVYSGTRNDDPTLIVVQQTGPKDKATDDLKKGFGKTSDPGLLEWAAAQLLHFETNKEDI